MAKAASYVKEIGWSSLRSVERLLSPEGIVVVVAKLIGVRLLNTFPKAIVPSWQERHKIEEPSGCPGNACMVELLYRVYTVP